MLARGASRRRSSGKGPPTVWAGRRRSYVVEGRTEVEMAKNKSSVSRGVVGRVGSAVSSRAGESEGGRGALAPDPPPQARVRARATTQLSKGPRDASVVMMTTMRGGAHTRRGRDEGRGERNRRRTRSGRRDGGRSEGARAALSLSHPGARAQGRGRGVLSWCLALYNGASAALFLFVRRKGQAGRVDGEGRGAARGALVRRRGGNQQKRHGNEGAKAWWGRVGARTTERDPQDEAGAPGGSCGRLALLAAPVCRFHFSSAAGA